MSATGPGAANVSREIPAVVVANHPIGQLWLRSLVGKSRYMRVGLDGGVAAIPLGQAVRVEINQLGHPLSVVVPGSAASD